jgi:hypothetical protein
MVVKSLRVAKVGVGAVDAGVMKAGEGAQGVYNRTLRLLTGYLYREVTMSQPVFHDSNLAHRLQRDPHGVTRVWEKRIKDVVRIILKEAGSARCLVYRGGDVRLHF